MTLTQDQKDLRKKWIEALRSGRFKQTSGVLERKFPEGHCCLGVLCRVLQPEGDIGHLKKTVESNATHLNPFTEELLNDTTRKLVGISDDEQRRLASWNDTGIPFSEIALRLEKDLD